MVQQLRRETQPDGPLRGSDGQYAKVVRDINIYTLSYPVCLGTTSSGSTTRPFSPSGHGSGTPWRSRIRGSPARPGLPSAPEKYERCVDDFALAHLNRNDTKGRYMPTPRPPRQECPGKTAYGTLMPNFTLHVVPVESIYLELLASSKNLSIPVFSAPMTRSAAQSRRRAGSGSLGRSLTSLALFDGALGSGWALPTKNGGLGLRTIVRSRRHVNELGMTGFSRAGAPHPS